MPPPRAPAAETPLRQRLRVLFQERAGSHLFAGSCDSWKAKGLVLLWAIAGGGLPSPFLQSPLESSHQIHPWRDGPCIAVSRQAA